MRRVLLVGVLVVLAVGTVWAGPLVGTTVADPAPNATDARSDATGASPSVTSVYPNPRADGDPGEYVVVRFPEATNASGWRIVDDDGQTAALPNATLSGPVLLTPEPDAVEGDPDAAVRALDGELRLANGGEALSLRGPDDAVVDAVAYGNAPEGEQYRRVGETDWRWRPPGATSLEPVETTPTDATAFVLPDAPNVVVEELRAADERILLAGYTFSSDRVAGALIDAHERGVEVRVLLEGSPVGGVSQRQVDALDRLVAAGVEVTVLAGEADQFRYHHAKYVVVDDTVIVLSENWKPSGVGGHSNRGWGAVVRDPALADELAALFEADGTGPGTRPWRDHRGTLDPTAYGVASERYPQHFAPETVPVERARVLVAPDNARRELVELLRSANESIYVHQVGIDGMEDPLLRAAIDAARNGTEVEILLSSASYAEAENRALVAEIDALAAREDLPVSAELANPRGRFEDTHVKGAIVDERHVVVGSLNWNPTAYGENREVVVVLTGEEIAGYYAEVFRADARDRTIWRVPVGLVGLVVAAGLVAVLVGVVRIRWAG